METEAETEMIVGNGKPGTVFCYPINVIQSNAKYWSYSTSSLLELNVIVMLHLSFCQNHEVIKLIEDV